MDASHKVAFAPRAEADLKGLYEYILARNGDPRVARRYVHRLRRHCETLTLFPERGNRRNDLAAGLRTMGFERRATIAFVVTADTVLVLRIFYGGQNFERSFG